MVALAAKHGVGFFDVSSQDSSIWYPYDGKLICGSLTAVITPALDGGDAGDDDAKAFPRDIGGSRMRWASTTFAGVSVLIAVAIFTGMMSPPDKMSKKIVLFAGMVFWCAVAVSSWWSWAKHTLRQKQKYKTIARR
jgi:hypothetical protein